MAPAPTTRPPAPGPSARWPSDETASFDFVLDTTDPGRSPTWRASPPSPRPTSTARTTPRPRRVDVRTPIADLVIVKGVSPQEAVVGDTVTYHGRPCSTAARTRCAASTSPTPAPRASTVLDSDRHARARWTRPSGRWDVGTLAAGRLRAASPSPPGSTPPAPRSTSSPSTRPCSTTPTPADNESTATVTTLAPAVDVGVTKTVDAGRGSRVRRRHPAGPGRGVHDHRHQQRGRRGSPRPRSRTPSSPTSSSEGLTFVSSTGDGDLRPRHRHSGPSPRSRSGAPSTRTIRVTGTVVGQHTNTHRPDQPRPARRRPDQQLRLRDRRPSSSSPTSRSPRRVDPADRPTGRHGRLHRSPSPTTARTPPTTRSPTTPRSIPANITGHTTDNGTFDEATRTWTIPRLEPGETATLHRLGARQRDRAPGTTATWSPSSSPGSTDPDPDNNTATADLFVPAADIAVTQDRRRSHPRRRRHRRRSPSASATSAPTPPRTSPSPTCLPAGLTYVSSTATRRELRPRHRHLGHRRPRPGRPPADRRPGGPADHRARHAGTARSPTPPPPTASGAFPYDPDPTNNTDSASVTGEVPGADPRQDRGTDHDHRCRTAGDLPLPRHQHRRRPSDRRRRRRGLVHRLRQPARRPPCPSAAGSLAPGASVTCTSVYTDHRGGSRPAAPAQHRPRDRHRDARGPGLLGARRRRRRRQAARTDRAPDSDSYV